MSFLHLLSLSLLHIIVFGLNFGELIVEMKCLGHFENHVLN